MNSDNPRDCERRVTVAVSRFLQGRPTIHFRELAKLYNGVGFSTSNLTVDRFELLHVTGLMEEHSVFLAIRRLGKELKLRCKCLTKTAQ